MQKRIQIKMMTDNLTFLKKAQEFLQNGETEKAEELFDTEIAELKRKKEKLDFPDVHREEDPQLVKLISMESADTIYENDAFSLVPIKTKELAKQYLEVRIENAVIPSLYEEETTRQGEMDEVLEDRTLYCGIISKEDGAFTGYCGINNVFAETPELAIALLKKYQHKRYGFESLNAFMKTVNEMTGISQFIAKVDPENVASQQLMLKLGFKPAGIATFLIDDADKLRDLEEENMAYLTEDLVKLAGVFNVEPRKLLSHLLVYAINI